MSSESGSTDDYYGDVDDDDDDDDIRKISVVSVYSFTDLHFKISSSLPGAVSLAQERHLLRWRALQVLLFRPSHDQNFL